MIKTGFFSSLSPAVKLFWLVVIFFFFFLLSTLTGLILIKWFYHINPLALSNLINNPELPGAKPVIYLYQITNQIGVFIVGTLFYLLLMESAPIKYLGLKNKVTLFVFILSAITVYLLLPFNNFLAQWNGNIKFPQALEGIYQWMKAKELQADAVTRVLLNGSTIGSLSLNLLVIALLPALGEELLFRGVIQQLFQAWIKNYHWAIWITAFIFSSIHFQFFGFLPRFVLGLLLGYLFVYTRNLWVPILIHFVNNASSIIVYYLHYNGFIKVDMDHFGAIPSVAGILASLFITIATVYWIKKLIEKQNKT